MFGETGMGLLYLLLYRTFDNVHEIYKWNIINHEIQLFGKGRKIMLELLVLCNEGGRGWDRGSS